MYHESDYTEIKKQVKQTIIITAVIALIFIIPAIAFLLRKPQWIGATFLSVGICLSIFIWGVYGTPVYSYYRYIRDILEGRTRETTGKVIRIAEEPVYKDNRLLFYEVIVEDAADGVERILLLDENKGKPQLQIGSRYFFRTHQNFIIHTAVS